MEIISTRMQEINIWRCKFEIIDIKLANNKLLQNYSNISDIKSYDWQKFTVSTQ